MQLLLAAQLVVLAALVAVSVWGWKEIPRDARIPTRAGLSGVDFKMGKTTALISTPIIGVLVVAASASASDEEGTSVLPLLGLVLLVFLLLTHLYSVRRAAR